MLKSLETTCLDGALPQSNKMSTSLKQLEFFTILALEEGH